MPGTVIVFIQILISLFRRTRYSTLIETDSNHHVLLHVSPHSRTPKYAFGKDSPLSLFNLKNARFVDHKSFAFPKSTTLKLIVSPCAGQTYPKTGQTVVVHYTGKCKDASFLYRNKLEYFRLAKKKRFFFHSRLNFFIFTIKIISASI